jgi:predicted nucleotidyltransferase
MYNDYLTNKDRLTNDIIRLSGIHSSRIFNITVFGSQVYDTANKDSDWDIIMVANNSVESTEIRKGLFNIHVYTPDKFKKDLEWHRINNLECIFAPDWSKLKETIYYKKDFKLDIAKLRHATSHISSNSWVKAKKKITLSDEYHIGIKSLFHSIRIPDFSNQIIEFGYIKDFNSSNHIWYDLLTNRYNWDELEIKYKPVRNKIMSDFRSVSYK